MSQFLPRPQTEPRKEKKMEWTKEQQQVIGSYFHKCRSIRNERKNFKCNI